MKNFNEILSKRKSVIFFLFILFTLLYTTGSTNAQSPCGMIPDLIIPGGSNSTTFGSADFNGGINPIVFIDGDFLVNTNLTISNNCTVLMKSCSRIIVTSLCTLTVSKSIITGCTDMWDKIELMGAYATINVRNSTIAQANFGIYCHDKTNFSVDKSSINACRIGIYTEPTTGGGFNAINGSLTQSFIGQTAVIGPQCAGMPSIGIVPYCGMELNDMIMSIGDNNLDYNLFAELNIGIISRRSILTVNNSKFDAIFKDGAYGNSSYDGSAIYVSGGSSTYSLTVNSVINSPGAVQITMAACDYGIYCENNNTYVDKVNIQAKRGMYFTKCNNNIVTSITNCDIFVDQVGYGPANTVCYGIRYFGNAGASMMKAESNKIDVHNFATGWAYGIILTEPNIQGNAHYRIIDNDITVYDGRFGILCYNVYFPLISYNTIIRKVSATGNDFFGIYNRACDRPSITCNTITGYDPNQSLTVGIQDDMGSNGYFFCNNVSDTYQGFSFNTSSGGITFNGNTMNDHYEGLYLNQNALLGQQLHAGNKWVGTYGSGFGAVNNNTNPADVTLNEFDVNTSSSPLFPTNSSPALPGGWFITTLGTTWNACYYDPHSPQDQRIVCGRPDDDPSPDFIDNQNDFTQLDKFIATGGKLSDYFPDETRQRANQYLYDKLSDMDVINQTDPDIISFYKGLQGTAYEYLKNAKDHDAAIYTYDEYNSSIQKDNKNIIDKLSILLAQNEQLIANGNADKTIIDATETIRNQISAAADEIKKVETEHATLKSAEIAAAIQANNLASTSEIVLSNQQLVNSIYLETIAQGIDNFNESQMADLLYVAQQCPYAGGTAVIQARVMYEMFNDNMVYDDELACMAQNSFKYASKEKGAVNLQTSIYPNPAIESATLLYESANTSDLYKLIITDISGKAVTEYSVSALKNNFTFSTSSLKPGFYLYKLFSGDSILSDGKLIISK